MRLIVDCDKPVDHPKRERLEPDIARAKPVITELTDVQKLERATGMSIERLKAALA